MDLDNNASPFDSDNSESNPAAMNTNYKSAASERTSQLRMVPFYTEADEPRRRKFAKRSRVEHIWSVEETVQFLRDVRANRVLWDVNAERCSRRRDNIWQKIADAIPTTVNDCKGKFTNLRTTYAMNVEKYRRQQEAGVAEPSIMWKFFKMMRFLDTNSSTVSSLTATSDSPVDIIPISAHLGLSCESPKTTPDVDALDTTSKTPESQFSQSGTTMTNSSSTVRSPSPSPTTASQSVHSEEMTVEPLMTNMHSVASSSQQHMQQQQQQQPRDPSVVFCEYIASELSSLRPEQAAFVRSKLRRAFNDILDDALWMPSPGAAVPRKYTRH